MSDADVSPKLVKPTEPAHTTSWIYKEPELVREYLEELFIDWSGHGFNFGRHHDFSPAHKIAWQNEKPVGEGAYGNVFSTHIKVEGKESTAIAIKQVSLDYGDTPKQLSEIKIIKRLRHKHVVELLGSYTFCGDLYLLLHPLAPSNLQEVLYSADLLRSHFAKVLQPGTDAPNILDKSMSEVKSTDNLTWRLTSRLSEALCICGLSDSERTLAGMLNECVSRLFGILGCIAESVAYIHGHNVHHKDIKPGNILICSQDQGGLRLTDFGFSKERTDPHSMVGKSLTGTFDYVPPEQYIIGGKYGIEADVFSLGCVFLEIMVALTLDLLSQPERFQDLIKVTTLVEENRAKHQSAPWLRWQQVCKEISFRYKYESSSIELELYSLIQQMVEIETKERPKANEVVLRLGILEQVRKTKDQDGQTSFPLFGSCCRGPVLRTDDYRLLRGIFGTEGNLKVPPERHLRNTLHVNSSGQRIDPPLEAVYDKAEFVRVASLNMCNNYHLLDYCESAGSCKYVHYTNASENDIRMLRRITRSRVKCSNGLDCVLPDCIYGHNCPFARLEPPYSIGNWLLNATRTDKCAHGGPRNERQFGRGGTCIYGPEMHDLDLTGITPPIPGTQGTN